MELYRGVSTPALSSGPTGHQGRKHLGQALLALLIPLLSSLSGWAAFTRLKTFPFSVYLQGEALGSISATTLLETSALLLLCAISCGICLWWNIAMFLETHRAVRQPRQSLRKEKPHGSFADKTGNSFHVGGIQGTLGMKYLAAVLATALFSGIGTLANASTLPDSEISVSQTISPNFQTSPASKTLNPLMTSSPPMTRSPAPRTPSLKNRPVDPRLVTGTPTRKSSTHVVVRGESLWGIAEQYAQHARNNSQNSRPKVSAEEIANLSAEIYLLNQEEIGPNPHLISPGMELSLPS